MAEFLVLDLPDQRVASQVTERHQQQGEVREPDEGAKDNARELQVADIVEHRLTFGREDVDQRAHHEPGLRAYGRAP